MMIKFNVPGKKRKEMVQHIGKWLGSEIRYEGAPSFAYTVDCFRIDRDGILSFDDTADSAVIERLLESLYDNGFEFEALELPAKEETETETGLTVQMPASAVSLGNLTRLLEAKGELFKKALGIDSVEITTDDERVSFPWFRSDLSPEEVKAYTHFISGICEMTRNQKRITAREKEVDNEKYAFRCFLLRIGFIGAEFKAERKILLSKLSGSSAFKTAKQNEEETVCE